MKTTKVILFAALMAFATIGFSQTDNVAPIIEKPGTELSIVIPLRTAMQNISLLRAMCTQLDPGFLIVEKPSYTVPVKIRNRVYFINGSFNDWKHFFAIKPY